MSNIYKGKFGIIYSARNTLNDMVYIGATTVGLKERIRMHYKYSNSNRCRNKFGKALLETDRENWVWEIIESDIKSEYLSINEIFYIGRFNSYNNGYNGTPGNKLKFKRNATNNTKENIRHVFNTITQEEVIINCYDFINKYYSTKKDLSVIYTFFNGKFLRFREWIFFNNIDKYNLFKIETKERLINSRLNPNLFSFQNINTGEIRICTMNALI